MLDPLRVTYRVVSDAASIEERARAIAVEQSVEMPVAAITDAFVRNEIMGEVLGIRQVSAEAYEVEIALSPATVGGDAGQLLNMLFGNTSLHESVTLADVELPPGVVKEFGGPHQGIEGLRRRAGVWDRALACAALKPQGLAAKDLADLARRLAEGGIDYLKDDHGLADQAYSPFDERVRAVADALSGGRTQYVPSLSGDLDGMRTQIETARAAGIGAAMLAPMIAGLATLHRLTRDFPDMAFFAHPAMAGAARIAPPLLIGKLFRIVGADAVIFPNHGGRFGYSKATCAAIAAAARGDGLPVRPAMPVPAGGMTPDRTPEILDFHGADIMLLIGGGLLTAGERLAEETAAFMAAVRNHPYDRRTDRSGPDNAAQGA